MTLQEFFSEHKKVAIALSGGVDSVLLMHMAKLGGAKVRAYFAKSEFQPEFELSDARRAAEEAGVPLSVIRFSALENKEVLKNQADRCYHCKKRIMELIKSEAASDGYDIVCDGTNASDDVSDRPGYLALGELGILSPLRICGITKDEVRRLAREAGISVWDKPSYACLATRIKGDEEITAKKLSDINAAENFLRSIGFSDFRVRTERGSARLELRARDMERLMQKREEIVSELRKYFSPILIDLEARDEKLCV